jgi:hypothetical protein
MATSGFQRDLPMRRKWSIRMAQNRLTDQLLEAERVLFEGWYVENNDLSKDPLGGIRSMHQWDAWLARAAWHAS